AQSGGANPCVGLASAGALYQTATYIPNGPTVHLRTDPTRKDLFVKYRGFSTVNPFSLGAAFNNAGIDVHVVDLTTRTPGESNIDSVLVINGGKAANHDGHIAKQGLRNWSFDTKGLTSPIGDGVSYGLSATYQIAADFYFDDRPYKDQL